MIASVQQLADAVLELAGDMGIALAVRISVADGYGSRNVPILDVSETAGREVRIWEEGDGDFLFEVGPDHEFGAWWSRRPKEQSSLPQVVLKLVSGRYRVVGGRLTVRVQGRTVSLRDQM